LLVVGGRTGPTRTRHNAVNHVWVYYKLKMAKVILITGGCRSGKSIFADKLAFELSHNVVYIATGQGLDAEMRQRIKVHKTRRSDRWRTIEAPTDVDRVVSGLKDDPLILIDCLTMLISNYLMEGYPTTKILRKIDALIKTIRQKNFVAIIVTNEVGSGVVPDNRLARDFRDLAGKVNQSVAKEADEVYLMVSGIPQRLK